MPGLPFGKVPNFHGPGILHAMCRGQIRRGCSSRVRVSGVHPVSRRSLPGSAWQNIMRRVPKGQASQQRKSRERRGRCMRQVRRWPLPGPGGPNNLQGMRRGQERHRLLPCASQKRKAQQDARAGSRCLQQVQWGAVPGRERRVQLRAVPPGQVGSSSQRCISHQRGQRLLELRAGTVHKPAG